MSEVISDPSHQKIILGIQASAAVAVERARKTGTKLVLWQNGKIVEIAPEDIHFDIRSSLPSPE